MKPFLIGLAIGTAILLLFINFGSSFRPEQPISFNHKKHHEQGIECARRTVAKYREGLKIAPASLRKAL